MVLCWVLTHWETWAMPPSPGLSLSSWEPEIIIFGIFLPSRGVVQEMFAECMEFL